MSNRLDKVNSLLEHEISKIIARAFSFHGALVTLTRVDASANLIEAKAYISVLPEEKTDQVCERCGKPMVIKFGRFGKFLACTGFPECKNTKPLDGNGQNAEPPKETGEKCPECASPLVKRKGRFGEFVGCSNYPKCKYIKKNQAEFGPCPKCIQGKIVGKRSRRGFFFGCNRYPECDFAIWGKPVMAEGATEPEKCPTCGSILVYAKEDQIKCSSKECKYKRDNE